MVNYCPHTCVKLIINSCRFYFLCVIFMNTQNTLGNLSPSHQYYSTINAPKLCIYIFINSLGHLWIYKCPKLCIYIFINALGHLYFHNCTGAKILFCGHLCWNKKSALKNLKNMMILPVVRSVRIYLWKCPSL